jgi:hypothetical protein
MIQIILSLFQHYRHWMSRMRGKNVENMFITVLADE